MARWVSRGRGALAGGGKAARSDWRTSTGPRGVSSVKVCRSTSQPLRRERVLDQGLAPFRVPANPTGAARSSTCFRDFLKGALAGEFLPDFRGSGGEGLARGRGLRGGRRPVVDCLGDVAVARSGLRCRGGAVCCGTVAARRKPAAARGERRLQVPKSNRTPRFPSDLADPGRASTRCRSSLP